MAKKHFIIGLLSMFCIGAWSQDASSAAKAPSVPDAGFDYKSKAEYDDTSIILEELVRTNPTDENAWLNYYKAARYKNYTEHSENISKEAQKKLDDILGRMNNAVPNSYAWNYCSFINSNRSDQAVPYLKKAYELRPLEKELWDDMLAEACISGDEKGTLEFSGKLEKSAIYTNAAMEYSRNVLNSVEKDGILITNGNLDTYPVLIFQKQHQYRTDVRIICLDWMGSARYAEQVSKIFSLKKEKMTVGKPYASLETILQNSKNYNIYLALTIPPDVLSLHLSDLYCTGLAMKYSKKTLQNLESLKYNWEFLFQITSISDGEDINRNYLLPLTLLRDHYLSYGETVKAEAIRKRIDEIAARFGLQSAISNTKN